MGGFIWHELATVDPDAAEAFYSRLLGWEGQTFAWSGPTYRIMSAAGAGVAGICAGPEGRPSGWIGYVHVGDLEAASDWVVAGGGELGEADEVPGIGRMRLVRDPSGAAVVLMVPSPREAPPVRPPEGTPGVPVWDELYSDDPGAAFDFYAGLAGWTKDTALDMGEMGTYQMFTAGGPAIGGIMRVMGEMPPLWLVYFTVASVTASSALARDLGARQIFGPEEVPGGMWIAQFLDPKGHIFGLVGPLG